MAKSKKAAIPEGTTPLDLAKELHSVTRVWRNSYLLSGAALTFVKEKAADIYEALGGTEEELDTEENAGVMGVKAGETAKEAIGLGIK